MLTIKPALNLTLVLFFTSYVMSSGPRYVRQLNEKYKVRNTESVSPLQAMKRALVKPYVTIWESRNLLKKESYIHRVRF